MANEQKNNTSPSTDEVPTRVAQDLILPLRLNYVGLIGWGIFCILLGTIGIIIPATFSIGVTIFVGAILLVAGATGLALFYKVSGWAAKTATVISALLSTIAGFILLFHPLFGSETLTLFIASYFIAMGVVKFWLSATNTDTKGWKLMLFSAIISIALGICLWWGWPQTAPYVLGIFVAIELLFDGWTAFMFGLEIRSFIKHQKENPS